MQLTLSQVLILCVLLNSIFCKFLENIKWDASSISVNRILLHYWNTQVNHQAFSHRLLKILLAENPRKNIIFSPMSISTTLAMVSMGIRSITFINLLKGLGFDCSIPAAEDMPQLLLTSLWRMRQLERMGLLKQKNLLFIDDCQKISPMFLKDVEKAYEAHVRLIDFHNTRKAKKKMDLFMAEKIQVKTKELIDSLNPHTFMVLVNYVFFRGTGEEVIHADLVEKEDFFVDEHTTVRVDMMAMTEIMIYSRWEKLSTTMVELPYTENISIVLVLPDDGKFHTLLKTVALQQARWVCPIETRLVELFMPKFKISSKINLKNVLPNLNIKEVFTPAANVSGITEEVFSAVFEAMHVASMELSERGLRRAEVRNKDFQKEPSAEPLVLRFNKPFLVIVTDHLTRSELLVGRVFNPLAE